MHRYKIDVDVDTWIERDPDPDDSWDIGDETGSITSVKAVRMSDWEAEHYSDPGRYGGQHVIRFDVNPGETVIALVSCTETGCTFGRTGVLTMVHGIWPASEAEIAQERKAELEQNSDYSVPWNGYFEDLVSLELYTCIVQA